MVAKMESAQKWFTFISMLFLALCLFIAKGLAIECFMCNSHLHGNDCESLPEDKQYLYTQNCDFLPGNNTHTWCRKMFQTLQGKERVIRQCGVRGEMGCITRSGTRNVRITYCHCKGNLCNQGPLPLPHLSVVLPMTIVTYVIPRLHATLGA